MAMNVTGELVLGDVAEFLAKLIPEPNLSAVRDALRELGADPTRLSRPCDYLGGVCGYWGNVIGCIRAKQDASLA